MNNHLSALIFLSKTFLSRSLVHENSFFGNLCAALFVLGPIGLGKEVKNVIFWYRNA
jgi:hypothetical protein